MKKPVLLVLLCLILGSFAFGQNKEAEKYYRKGNRYYKRSHFLQALPYLKYAVNLAPDKAEYCFAFGRSLFETGQQGESLPFFIMAYNANRDADPMILHYLARSHHYMGYYQDAQEFYQADINERLDANEDSLEIAWTLNAIKHCRNAPSIMEEPMPFEIVNLGGFVNSRYPEYAATYAEQFGYMVYTSRRPRRPKRWWQGLFHAADINEEVYEAHLEDSVWMRTHLFSKPIPVLSNDASVSVAEDGNLLIFYDDDNSGDIFISRKVNDEWTKRESIGDNINTEDWNEPSVFITDNGETLYWVSDKPGGKGGKDIYVSKRDPDGSWGEGENLGDRINTPFDEDAPFITDDGKRLFFASRGLPGMGGYDIFRCDRLPDGSWSAPVNLGYPVNSPGEDIYYVEADKDRFFFSSNRAGGFGHMDLYMGQPATEGPAGPLLITGTVKDKVSGEPVDADVLAVDADNGDVLAETRTDHNGAYELQSIKTAREITIQVKVKGETVAIETGELHVVTGNIQDLITGSPLNAQVELIDVNTNEVVETASTNPETGRYYIPVESGRRYVLRVNSQEYLPYYEDLVTDPSGRVEAHSASVGLHKLTEGNKLVLGWQFFEFDRSVVKKDYQADLDNLAQLMTRVEKLKLSIIGHTDASGSETYNEKLSMSRAQAVADYLQRKGVDRSRLYIDGRGEKEPLYPNKDPKTARWNRRVEIYIIQ